MYDLQGKTSLVTGAAQGLGRGIALELAKAGANVVIADLKQEKAKVVVDQIKALGVDAIAIECDVTDDLSVTTAIQDALNYFPAIDILVNNAGVFQKNLGVDTTMEDFNINFQVNLNGIWRVSKTLVPHFQENISGKIINISSIGGRKGIDFAPAYCASKAGVISLTQSMAAELGLNNINVNTVCPGSIDTAMMEEIRALRKNIIDSKPPQTSRAPIHRTLTAEDIGQAVVFFASDNARNITGQALNVDCGSQMN